MLNDSAFNVGASANSYSYSVSNPGEYTLKVRAKGDTADFILSGEYSTVLTGYKLHAPEITNISDASALICTDTVLVAPALSIEIGNCAEEAVPSASSIQ